MLNKETRERLASEWVEHMKGGQFENAWKISDQLLHSNPNNENLPLQYRQIWNGESLKGKRVWVQCNHGLGDTIQFIRFIPQLSQIAAHVLLSAQHVLLPLLQTVKGIDEFKPYDQVQKEDYDVAIEIMELQYIFRVTPETIPATVPYFSVPDVSVIDKKQLRVGLVWQSSEFDFRRNINFDQLSPITSISNIDWYIFQVGSGLEQRPVDFGSIPEYKDVLEEASVLKSLDVLISVDSMPAHFGGALGVGTWNLLHTEADWRWMRNRNDSPWYPTMRLFRQKQLGDWEPVIQEVSRCLKQKLSEKQKPTLQ